ncbi:MAG: YbaY family lipoprotein [Opitutaceae bacterium]
MNKTPFRHLALLPAAFLTVFLAACGGGRSAKATTPASEEATAMLENTDWILVELNGKPFEAGTSLKTPTLRFDDETGMVAGNSGVNQYGGSYTVRGDSIEFGPMRSTMMAGPPEAMDLEQAFLAALVGQTGWRIADGRLEFSEGESVAAAFVVAPSAAKAVVSGTVVYRERMMLRPGSVLEVTLEDVSLADVPARQIATYRKEDPGSPPFPFELLYDPGTIDERHTYAVRARITVEEQLRFTSDTTYPVITRGHGNKVEILVKGVPTAD